MHYVREESFKAFSATLQQRRQFKILCVGTRAASLPAAAEQKRSGLRASRRNDFSRVCERRGNVRVLRHDYVINIIPSSDCKGWG